MRKYLLLIIIAYGIDSFAQGNNKTETLNDFFAGVPLQESFESWVHYVTTHPYLGIDSFNSRGLYSSFKPGIKNYFPFSDSMKVKLLFQKTVYYDSLTNNPTDSINDILIEGVFQDNKVGKKESIEVFKTVRKKLRANYYNEYMYPDYERYVVFFEGKNMNFPDCFLTQSHSDDLRFYYVMIYYVSPRKKTQQ